MKISVDGRRKRSPQHLSGKGMRATWTSGVKMGDGVQSSDVFLKVELTSLADELGRKNAGKRTIQHRF